MKSFTVYVKRGEGTTSKVITADYWAILDNGVLMFYRGLNTYRALSRGYWKDVYE